MCNITFKQTRYYLPLAIAYIGLIFVEGQNLWSRYKLEVFKSSQFNTHFKVSESRSITVSK